MVNIIGRSVCQFQVGLLLWSTSLATLSNRFKENTCNVSRRSISNIHIVHFFASSYICISFILFHLIHCIHICSTLVYMIYVQDMVRTLCIIINWNFNNKKKGLYVALSNGTLIKEYKEVWFHER